MKRNNARFDILPFPSAATEPGRIVAIDPGAKRVGVAISDELRVAVRPLPAIPRGNWKQLLRAVTEVIESFAARALVIGLPLRLDGTEGASAAAARELAAKFRFSLRIPVYLQDERLTTFAARENLKEEGHGKREIGKLLDSESAAIILRDFLAAANAD